MSLPIHQAANHMNTQMRSMDMIANNLANANTPGFRRMISHFTTTRADTHWGLTEVSFPRLDMTMVDYTQGAIKRTDRYLDVAINGDGFLMVDTEEGPRLTRKGRMYMDREGGLRDSSGNPYLSDAGALQLPEHWQEIIIDRYGNLSVDGESLGQLALVNIPDKQNLRPAGGALFEYTGEQMEDAIESELVQGAIEKSNIEPVTEIVNLMRATRSYEAGSQIMKRIDSLQGHVINKAG